MYPSFVVDFVSNNKGPCHLARTNSNPGMMDGFVPQCQYDGSFERKQCHDGDCWCVNPKSGRELQGTRTPFNEVELNCGIFIFTE